MSAYIFATGDSIFELQDSIQKFNDEGYEVVGEVKENYFSFENSNDPKFFVLMKWKKAEEHLLNMDDCP